MKDKEDKIRFINRVFKNPSWTKNHLNVNIKCPNKKCPSHLTNRLKYAFRIDNDVGHCWMCKVAYNNLIPVFKSLCPSALKEYLQDYMPKKFIYEVQEGEEDKVILPQDFDLLALATKSPTWEQKRALNYLKNRNFEKRDLWFYKLGISQEQEFWRYVIFPSFDEEFNLNYWVARILDPVRKINRYKQPLVKSKTIVVNECYVDWKKPLILTEGIFDLMKCAENATCLLGSSLSTESKLFHQICLNQTPIILALDKDAKDKEFNIAKLLNSYDIDVYKFPLFSKNCKFNDVGEMTKNDFKELYQNITSWNDIDFMLTLY